MDSSKKAEKCFRCGSVKVNTHSENGIPICRACIRVFRPKQLCRKCGELTFLRRVNDTGEFICDSCAKVDASFACGVCKKEKRGYPQKRRFDGAPVCNACVRAKISFLCGLCDREIAGYPYSRREDGKPVCQRCSEKKLVFRCGLCNKETRGHLTRDGDKFICRSCAASALTFHCDICKKEKKGYPVKKRLGNPICFSCAKAKTRFRCVLCTQQISGFPASTEGGMLCYSCHRDNSVSCFFGSTPTKRSRRLAREKQPKTDCSMCGNRCRTVAEFDKKPVCYLCYTKHLAPLEKCCVCAMDKPVAKRINSAGMVVCRNCSQSLLKSQKLKLRGPVKCTAAKAPLNSMVMMRPAAPGARKGDIPCCREGKVCDH